VERVHRPQQEPVEQVDGRDVGPDGHGNGRHRLDRPQLGMVLDVVGGGVQPRAGRHDRAERHDGQIAEPKRAFPVGAEHIRLRDDEEYVHHIPNVSPMPATATNTASNDHPCALTTADNEATVPTTPSPSAMIVSRP